MNHTNPVLNLLIECVLSDRTEKIHWGGLGTMGLDRIYYRSTHGLVTLLRVWFIVGYANPGQSLVYRWVC